MSFYGHLPNISPDIKTVITIGVFDGIHLGHQHLLNELGSIAKKLQAKSVVITFSNHPRKVLSPTTEIQTITPLETRISIIKNNGIDIVIPISFTEEFSKVRAEEFVDIMQKQLNMVGMVVGPDFAMGFQREGTVAALEAMGNERDFFVIGLDKISIQGERISSSSVRDAITSGNLGKAANLLGRNFQVEGKITEGLAIGRTLGFPTANLDIDSIQLLPANGIYATWARFDDQTYMSATSIGHRPTFGNYEKTIESYLLDFDGDIYGKHLTLTFVDRIRDDIKFNNQFELIDQMHIDVKNIRETLSKIT